MDNAKRKPVDDYIPIFILQLYMHMTTGTFTIVIVLEKLNQKLQWVIRLTSLD